MSRSVEYSSVHNIPLQADFIITQMDISRQATKHDPYMQDLEKKDGGLFETQFFQ